MACENCAALRARVTELEGLLGLERQVDRLALLAAATRLQPQCGRLVLRLYAAYPRYISRRVLEDSISANSHNQLSVQLSRIRTQLGQAALITEREVGVRLGDDAKAFVDKVLAQQVA